MIRCTPLGSGRASKSEHIAFFYFIVSSVFLRGHTDHPPMF
jgi:hypothetical protein